MADLMNPLLPQVMRCLPDWAEVERGTYPKATEGTTEVQEEG